MKNDVILVMGVDTKSLSALARAAIRSTIGSWMFSGQKGGRRYLRRELAQKRAWFVSYAVNSKRSRTKKSAVRAWYIAIKKVAGGVRVACDATLDQLKLPEVS